MAMRASSPVFLVANGVTAAGLLVLMLLGGLHSRATAININTCCMNGQRAPDGRYACDPTKSGLTGDVDGWDKRNGCATAYSGSGGGPYDLSDCIQVAGAGADPHITGFDGSDYLLWGKLNTTYNLLSERHHQVNIHLYHPAGRADSHALYIDAVGVMVNDARVRVQLVPATEANPTAAMELTISGAEQAPVTWTGQPVERAVDAHTSYAFRNEHHIVISSSDITLSIVLLENDHLDVYVDEVAAYWGDVHGIMGQSHSAAFKLKFNYAKNKAVGDLPIAATLSAAAKKNLALQGKEDDYITSGLFETDDKYSRFAVGAATRQLMRRAGATSGGNSMKVKSLAGVACSDSQSSVIPYTSEARRSLLAAALYVCSPQP